MKLDDYSLFRKQKGSLHDLSEDKHDGQSKSYMTDSQHLAVAFDDVKREYCNMHKLSDHRSGSVDAVMENGTDIVFIEFKNGNFTPHEVKEKGNESMMIFCDVTGKHISDTRNTVDFFLVYNEAVKPLRADAAKAKRMAELSGLPYVRFDMDKHEGLCFRRIRTYDRTEFDQWLKENKLYE